MSVNLFYAITPFLPDKSKRERGKKIVMTCHIVIYKH